MLLHLSSPPSPFINISSITAGQTNLARKSLTSHAWDDRLDHRKASSIIPLIPFLPLGIRRVGPRYRARLIFCNFLSPRFAVSKAPKSARGWEACTPGRSVLLCFCHCLTPLVTSILLRCAVSHQPATRRSLPIRRVHPIENAPKRVQNGHDRLLIATAWPDPQNDDGCLRTMPHHNPNPDT